MLFVHVSFGVVFGALALVVGATMGFSFWVAFSCFVLGANVGLLASLPAALLRPREKAPRLESV